MEWTPEIRELVEKYFADQLTGEEWREWQALMKVPQFRWYVNEQEQLRGIVKTSEEREGRGIGHDKKAVPVKSRVVRWMIFLVILSIITLIVLMLL